jgi:hypothetical protein
MTALPEGIAGKALALLLLLSGIAALWFAGLKPLADLYAANQQRLAEQDQLIEHLRLTAAELPRLRLAAARDGDPASGKLLIEAPSDAVAAAELQSALKALVAKNGAAITSAETLAAEVPGPFHHIGVRLAMTGDLALLTGVLKGVDEMRPAVVVDDLSVHTALPSTATGAGTAERRLAITIEIHGFRAE